MLKIRSYVCSLPGEPCWLGTKKTPVMQCSHRKGTIDSALRSATLSNYHR